MKSRGNEGRRNERNLIENWIVIDCFETSGQPLCKLLRTKGRFLYEKRGHSSRII